MKRCTIVLLLAAMAAGAQPEGHRPYAIVAGFPADDPFEAAVTRLAEHHDGALVLRFDPAAPAGLLGALRTHTPTHVAFVLRPEQIDVNSVRAILRLATRVDDDPFVDFAYGYITGATPDEARRFVDNIVRASAAPLAARVGQTAVWSNGRTCTAHDTTYRVGPDTLPSRSLRFRPPDGRHGRDQTFVDAELTSLEGCGALLLGGHGMPWEIISGPRTEDVDTLDLGGTVAFNYACYTAVTRRYAERAWGRDGATTRIKSIEPERSFALAMIRRGIVGYVAYVTPRPAGPEMHVDLQRTLAGESLGAVRRRDYAKVVLGYLGFGEAGIAVPDAVDGARVASEALDMVRHLMLDESTGGILYGDPAYRPFAGAKRTLPLHSSARVHDDELHISMRLDALAAGTWGADPFRRFKAGTRRMAMKVYDRIEVPADFGPIRSVRVARATWGEKAVETLPVVWAEEVDRGRRYLHVKANFARGGRGEIEVELVAGPRPPSAAEREAVERRTREAALTVRIRKLNRTLLRDPRAVAAERADLRALGEAGFAAVLEAIRDGEAHALTHMLVEATAVPGGEKRLLALARSPSVPESGRCAALRSLAAFDDPSVRDALLRRVARERRPAPCAAAASALAALGEPRAVDAVAKRLDAFDAEWFPVHWKLVHAIGTLGGDTAVERLAAYARDDRATNAVALAYAIDHLSRLDLAVAAATARAIVTGSRFAKFPQTTQERIRRVAGSK